MALEDLSFPLLGWTMAIVVRAKRTLQNSNRQLGLELCCWLTSLFEDCCDGSDESSGKCANTCEEDSKKYQAGVSEEIKMQERGLALRASYTARALAERERQMKLVVESETNVATLDTKVDELEKVKIEAENAYSAAHEKAQERLDAEKEAKYVCYFPFLLPNHMMKKAVFRVNIFLTQTTLVDRNLTAAF